MLGERCKLFLGVKACESRTKGEWLSSFWSDFLVSQILPVNQWKTQAIAFIKQQQEVLRETVDFDAVITVCLLVITPISQ